MKKLFSIILALSIVIALCPAFTANAAEIITSGNFTYRILEDDTVEICSYTGNSQEILINPYYDGRIVSSIADYAFMSNTTVNRLVIPDGVKHIGKSAFADCRSLQKLEIYSKVLETIGDYAFVNCVEVGYFELPPSLTHIGQYAVGAMLITDQETGVGYSNYDPYTNIIAEKGSLGERYALRHNMYLYDNVIDFFDWVVTIKDDDTAGLIRYLGNETNLYVPDTFNNHTLTSISPNAFMNNKNIESVKISKQVKSIGDYCFYGCDNLSKVSLPEVLEEIGECAFTNCGSLKELSIPYSVSYFGEHAIGYETYISSPGEVGFRPVSGFKLKCYLYSGADLYSLTYRLDCEPLYFCNGDFEYSNYYGLYAIIDNYVGDSADVYVPNYLNGLPVRRLETGTFTFNHTVETVTLSENILEIGEKAFENCYNLYSITLPGVCLIEDYAFAGCASLEQIDMPAVEEIDYGAFWECTSLCDVSFGERLDSIGDMAFFDCESLNHLSLPLSVTDIGFYAMGCYSDDEIIDFHNIKCYPYFSMTVYEHTISKAYANAFDIPYELMGDANGNGRAEVYDITKMQRALAGIYYGGSIDRELADVNRDGKFDINDVTLQQKILAYMYET